MKKTTLRFFIIGIGIFILPLVCLSQQGFTDGFIINNSNQRVEGQVEKLSNISNCKYVKFREGEHVDKYFPGQIRSWGIEESRKFISSSIEVNDFEEQVFLEYLVIGKVSLLCFYGAGDEPRFFVQKEGDELRELIYTVRINAEDMQVENKQYVGILNILLSDCKEVKEDIGSISFKLDNFQKLIVKYNDCIDPDALLFQRDIRDDPPVRVELAFGFNMPKYDVVSSDKDADDWIIDAENTPKNFISLGINLTAKVGTIEGMAFVLGAYYAETEFKFGGTTYTNTLLIFPIQIRYAYKIGKFNPYVSVGYNSILYPKHKGAYILFRTHHYGWNGGLGLNYKVLEFMGVYFEFRYQHARAVGYNPPKKYTPPFDYLTLKTNNFAFLTGVSF